MHVVNRMLYLLVWLSDKIKLLQSLHMFSWHETLQCFVHHQYFDLYFHTNWPNQLPVVKANCKQTNHHAAQRCMHKSMWSDCSVVCNIWQEPLYDLLPGMELTPTNPLTLKPNALKSPAQVRRQIIVLFYQKKRIRKID